MSSIDDIRINGQQTSEDLIPDIAGLQPVISWDFSEDAASFAQVGYSIKIGTSSIDLGSSSFIGDKVDISNISSSNFFEYKEHNLARGNIYYGQIKTTDTDSDETPWAIFIFRTNNLPFVTNFFLSPTSPSISDDIEVFYTYFDEDSHAESGTKIRWFKNNVLFSDYDDLCILPAKATSSGESWNVKIIPCDGLEFGSISETESVTIQNTQSSFESIIILPINANIDDILKAEYTLLENEYITTLGDVIFEWFINNVSVKNSNYQFIRLDLKPGDIASVTLRLIRSDETIIAEASSENIIIQSVDWKLFNISVDELVKSIQITNLTPIIEWNKHKSASGFNEVPMFFRLLVTKTPSMTGPIYDTGQVQYVKDMFVLPKNILSRGQDYYVHIAASDFSPIPNENYIHQRVSIIGSSWDENVNNSTGWTIETKFQLVENSLIDPFTGVPPPTESGKTPLFPRTSIYIHDGTYFCSITFEQKKVIFHSNKTVTVELSINETDLRETKTFRISGKNNDIKIFMNNSLFLDATGLFTSKSKLKFIEYGDLDGKYNSEILFRFFRYSTLGAFGLGDSVPNENTFYFFEIGKLKGGTIEYVQSNLISWLPSDSVESAKLIQLNENASDIYLPTVTKNFSPITTIHIDKNRNKYIGTSNGINAIYGEKHDPDYEFITSDEDVVITTSDFDRITTVNTQDISEVEPDIKLGWFTINTTFRTLGIINSNEGFATGDPYDPYKYGINSHAIHYYSQRTHGHAWYDKANNENGWQITFSFQLEKLEQDDFINENIEHKGFGVYINDGTYQEILYFYEDRIRLFYANVFVPIVTTSARNYRIVGKDQNLLIYQKLDNPSIASYQLIINGTGLFNTPSSLAGNSRYPKITFDSSGVYHAVWHDDGNGRSQIFYSNYDGSKWSNSEIIAKSKFNLKNPAITIDAIGRVWVVYEDTSWGQTEISVSVRDESGWNPPTRITNFKSNKHNPSIIIDVFENVHIVWEDNRNGPVQIFWAQRRKETEVWVSSGQYGQDTVIMQQKDFNDPYIEGSVQFKNPKLSYNHPRIWMVSEALKESENLSSIYISSFNIDQKYWQSMGVPVFDSNGDFISDGTSVLVTLPDRFCTNPSITINGTKGEMVVVWEDQTEPISQIWGAAFNSFGTEIVSPTKITSRTSTCSNPVIGFSANQAAIVFESDNSIYMSHYDSDNRVFNGSATGSSDDLIQTTLNREAHNPAVAQFVPDNNIRILYDFLRIKDQTLESTEFPDYHLIGEVVVTNQDIYPSETVSDNTVSNIDTKEFAFGDMSENISMIAHWKNIQMYFGYDAKPLSISIFNSSTVSGWGDDRINDIFVDIFGNLIVAKFDKLVYYNVFTGDLTDIQLEVNQNPIVTAVKWGSNGVWYVGTNSGLYISKSAGKEWKKYVASVNFIINDIDVDKDGNAICATNNGILIAHPDGLTTEILSIVANISQTMVTNNIRCVAVDENNVIWAGADFGLVRIENKINFLLFNKKNGMRSSYVTDISIVNKHLRYIATINGIDRMNGTNFFNINTLTHDILNNNISSIAWNKSTNSLWVGTLHYLYEIVFRDNFHEIIEDEIVQYDDSELLTEKSFDTTFYTILDTEELSKENLSISPESVKVLINKNIIDFGFSVGEAGKSILFDTPLLTRDEVGVFISNKFIQFYDFNQTDIEKKATGFKRTNITKIVKTITKNQTLLLTGIDKNQVLLFSEEQGLPFTTILLDRELPLGCLQQIDVLSPTTLKFKVLAYDPLSGIDGYILSNYENFTSDGETPLEFSFLPKDGIVTHNIGSGINNITTSLEFPDTTTLPDLQSVIVGNGSKLSKWTEISTNTVFLYATTNNPPIVWRYDPNKEEWTSIVKLDNDTSREVTDIKEFNNIIYIATGSTLSNIGIVYKSTDGINFQVASSTSLASHFNAIAASLDGVIYFGDSSGNIYDHKNNSSNRLFSGIGDKILSMDIWNNFLIVGTGTKGRVYLIDIKSDNDFIIFSGKEENINYVHIKDAMFSPTEKETQVYIGSSDSATIYRANMLDLDFVKSFSSYNSNITRFRSIDKFVLDPDHNINDSQLTQVVAAIENKLFKHNEPTWEFLFQQNEAINDFVQYGNPGSEGIYTITDSRIEKWTNQVDSKYVYLKLKDKAGNESSPPNIDKICPEDNAANDVFCCNYAYALKIKDLKKFVNESRIVDINADGDILFTFNSPNNKQFYSADVIDEEIGVYTSEILNGSNDLVSWKTITWVAIKPDGTFVDFQIRNAATESDIELEEWSPNLVLNSDNIVSIEHITNQYLQFRVILRSRIRDLSPTLTSVTIRNLATQASHFFTTNFILPSRPVKGLLTANTFIPVTSDVIFGINTKNTTDFGDYQIIEPNRLFTTTQGQFGKDFRIGIKLLSPSIAQINPTISSDDPYDAGSYICFIVFSYTNTDVIYKDFHFRIKFYNDYLRTQLIHTFFSGNEQTGWSYGSGTNTFSATGLTITSSETKTITFEPSDRVETDQKWFITIESWDGEEFEIVSDDQSYVCATCNLTNESNLISEYYKTGLPTLTTIPEFNSFTPDFSLLEDDISFDENFSDWVTSKGQVLPGFTDNFAIRFRGKIQTPVDGTYQFRLESTDGSILFIDAEEVINHNGTHGLTTKDGSIVLSAGFHDIEVQYFNSSGSSGLILKWIIPGDSIFIDVPNQRFYHTETNEYCDSSKSPVVYNFAIVFELENGENIKINLNAS